MSVRTATAVKAHLEALGTGVPVFVDAPPPGQQPPYLSVSDLLDLDPLGHGDNGDPDRDEAVAELAQVTLTVRSRDATRALTDLPEVVDQIVNGLDTATLTSAPHHVHGVDVIAVNRLIDPTGLTETVITLRVNRAMKRSP